MGWLNTVVGGSVGYAVAGPAGAVVGIGLASSGGGRDYDMSDIPFGANITSEYEDDDAGRRYRLTVLSDVPSDAWATLRLLDDAGQPLGGHPPFTDGDGRFVARAALRNKTCVVYLPHGAARYDKPKNISLEVGLGPHDKPPETKGVLDADLPSAAPWNSADYLAPIVVLCAHIVDADRSDAKARRAMVGRIAQDLAGATEDTTEAAMVALAESPSPLEPAARTAVFRFPGVTHAGFRQLFESVCFADDDATTEQSRRVTDVCGLLDAANKS